MSSRPHEAMFRAAFEAPANAAALLCELVPPAVRDAIDWGSLAPDRGSFVDPARPDRHNDLLFTAHLRVGDGARLFLLLEHQSTVDEAMPQRMLSYQIRIWDRFRKEHPEDWLPPVLAVLVSHAPGGWTAARTFEDLFDPVVMAIPGLRPLVPRCAMITLDLAELSDETLQTRALPPLQRLALWLLRDARDPERLLASFETWRPVLAEAGQDRPGLDHLDALIEYMFRVVAPKRWDELRAKLRTLGPRIEAITMTIADMLHEQGRIEVLRRLLLLKFKALDATAETRLQTATPEAIDRYVERLLSADSLTAVFEE